MPPQWGSRVPPVMRMVLPVLVPPQPWPKALLCSAPHASTKPPLTVMSPAMVWLAVREMMASRRGQVLVLLDIPPV